MDEEIASAQNAIASFQKLLGSAEDAIRPVLKAIEAIRESEDSGEIPPLTRARIHATLAYTVNALYYMYLRANAVESDTHPIVDDITRVQNAFSRLRAVETALSGSKSDEPKMFRSMRKAVKKLDAFLIPEEEDLFHAVKGATTEIDRSARKGHKRFADDDDDERQPEKSAKRSSRKKRKTKANRELDTEPADSQAEILSKSDEAATKAAKEQTDSGADIIVTPKSTKKSKVKKVKANKEGNALTSDQNLSESPKETIVPEARGVITPKSSKKSKDKKPQTVAEADAPLKSDEKTSETPKESIVPEADDLITPKSGKRSKKEKRAMSSSKRRSKKNK